jgi:hypothetical protein
LSRLVRVAGDPAYGESPEILALAGANGPIVAAGIGSGRPGPRRTVPGKVWAWWHPRSLELEDPPDRPDVQRCPHAVLPMPVFRTLGGQEKFGAHAWFRTYADAARALAAALRWPRELTDLEGTGPRNEPTAPAAAPGPEGGKKEGRRRQALDRGPARG